MVSTEQKLSSKVSIIDDALLKDTPSCHLSLQIGFHQFAFSISSFDNTYIALETQPLSDIANSNQLASKLKDILQQNTCLQNIYKTVSGVFVDKHSTLIPAALFDEEKKRDYLSFNHSLDKEATIFHDYLKTIDAYNIYYMPAPIKQLLASSFPTIHLMHHVSLLIEGLLFYHGNRSHKTLYVHVRPHYFELIVLQGKRLIFSNTFPYQTKEDIAYYVLYTCEQLELHPNEIPVKLLGHVEQKEELYNLLYQYIRNIDFLTQEDIQLSLLLQEVDKHPYFLLFNQHLCV